MMDEKKRGECFHLLMSIACLIGRCLTFCLISASNRKKGGMLGRIRQQECNPSEACIMATTKEIRTWMEDNPLISDLIMKITRDAKAFQCHPDKFDEAVNHAATFIFE